MAAIPGCLSRASACGSRRRSLAHGQRRAWGFSRSLPEIQLVRLQQPRRAPYVPRAGAFEQTGRYDLERVLLETRNWFGKEGEELNVFRRKAIHADQGGSHAGHVLAE